MRPQLVPRLDVLPASQRRVWRELVDLPDSFVLYGGTALALRLGHRQSVDFDFFSRTPLATSSLLLDLPFLVGAEVTQRAPNTLSCTIDRDGPVKLSFFGVPTLPILQAPAISDDNRVRVASFLDLAGTKLSVTQVRAEAKDYLDIDALLQSGHVDLPTALAAGRVLYGAAFNPQNALKALCYFEDGDLDRLPSDVKTRLIAAARDVDLDRLPEVVACTSL